MVDRSTARNFKVTQVPCFCKSFAKIVPIKKNYILIVKLKWFLVQCDAISTFMMSLEDAKLDHAHDSI